MMLLLALGACKSKKAAQRRDAEQTQQTDSSVFYKSLSEKVNLPLSKNDNVTLYLFVADWIGTPHKLGKCTKDGVDCSCFVKMLYEEVYDKKSPRTANDMYDVSKRIAKKEICEGDLVFFTIKSTRVSHVGVYLKDGWFAHVSTSKGVMINNLSEKYYQQYYAGAGRI
jgi:cell wall-associated NlpC family hydrolase